MTTSKTTATPALVRDLELMSGDILLLQIKGWIGWLVWLMQAINRDTSRWTHAAIVLNDGTVFEAQPGGAVITSLSEYADRPGAVVRYYQSPCHGRPSEYELLPLAPHMNPLRREDIDATARREIGIGYNWGTYVYLALYRFGVRPEWLKRRVQRDERMICSQAVDLVYSLCNLALFADGRMPYDVTPGDLARLV